MTDEQQFVIDEGDLRKYRTEIPNMADDDLGPYEYRLYAHYKRRGMCWESVRTTARVTQMSVGQVCDIRDWLCTNGWIQIHTDDSVQGMLITLVDRWGENFLRYSNQAQKEPTVHHMNSDRSPDEPKKEQYKEAVYLALRAFERYIGPLTPLLYTDIEKAVQAHNPDWLCEALELTQQRFVEGKCKHPSLAFALGIVRNWEEKGYTGIHLAAQGVEEWL